MFFFLLLLLLQKLAAVARRGLVGSVLGEIRVGSRANEQISCWWNERFHLVWPWCTELLLYRNELLRA